MNWDAIGALAELVGAIAVVVTLGFLGLQLRANSALLRTSTAQAQASGLSSWARQLATDPELHVLYRRGLREDDSLSADERARFDLILVQVFNEVASVYSQAAVGGGDIFDANLRTMEPVIATPGGRAAWARMKSMFDPAFQAEVDRFLDRPTEGGPA